MGDLLKCLIFRQALYEKHIFSFEFGLSFFYGNMGQSFRRVRLCSLVISPLCFVCCSLLFVCFRLWVFFTACEHLFVAHCFCATRFCFLCPRRPQPSATLRVPGSSCFEVLPTSAVEAGRYLRDWFERPEMHYLFYQACNMAVKRCQLVSLPFYFIYLAWLFLLLHHITCRQQSLLVIWTPR